jgi:hypothetical protein
LIQNHLIQNASYKNLLDTEPEACLSGPSHLYPLSVPSPFNPEMTAKPS